MSFGEHRPLEGQVAIVTGAGRGIGRAVATRLARDGAAVVVADLDSTRAAKCSSELNAAGVKTIDVTVDVGRRDSISSMIEDTLRAFGRLDIICNNAAIAVGASFMDTSEQLFADHVRINLQGVFNASQCAAKVMMEAGYGRIISIASICGLMGPADLSAYGASKAGVIGLTRSMALELADYNITANAVAPGPIDTELLRAGWSAETYAARAQQVPANRLGHVDEIAHAVAFLASPGAAYVSGVVIPVDGGCYAAGSYMAERYRRRTAAASG